MQDDNVKLKDKKNIKILLTGGGTGGSVSPLLAVVESAPLIKGGEGGFNFLWLGTKNGPEREMVGKDGIEFKAIYGGKFRRYFSWRNFVDPFFIIIGFIQSFFIILKWKPDLIISAGSFVSVPVVWAGWILRVPVLIHQQDARPGLANKLMAPFAKIITVTFEESLKDYGKKAVWTGNPVRQSIIRQDVKAPLVKGGKGGFLTVLVIGGGTGAMAINELVWKSLDELTKFCNVVHITGKNKIPPLTKGVGGIFNSGNGMNGDYKYFEFLNAEQMVESYAVADIVVSRAGMSVLTELSYLGKPAILIPIPHSHQEENAEIFNAMQAALVLNQEELTPGKLVQNIKMLLTDEVLCKELSNNIRQAMKRGANEEMAKLINNLLK